MKRLRVIPLVLGWSVAAFAADEVASSASSVADLGISSAVIALTGGMIWFAAKVIDAKTGWLEKIPGNVDPHKLPAAQAALNAAIDSIQKARKAAETPTGPTPEA